MKNGSARGLFITGTDTEVGKTVVAAGLAYGLRRLGLRVGVMKPVATGCARANGTLASADARALLRASGSRDPMDLVCPYRFEPPAAPLVAAENRYDVPKAPPVRRTVIERAFRELARRHDIVLVEGIGGLLVPLNSRESVADLARHLGLPVLVVARAGLGTINHTLLTIEAARSAGLNLAGVVLNGRSRRPSLAERTNPRVIRELGRVPILGVVPRLSSPSPSRVSPFLGAIQGRFIKGHVIHEARGEERMKCPRMKRPRIRRLSRLDRKRIWHPFTQMADWEKEEPLIVESGRGVYLTDVSGRRYLDGVSSLWVNLHGHANPDLDRALLRQAGKLAHSTLLGAANVPSIELAEELVRIAPKGLTRVFYSDNGSTAVEVALKMAFQYWQQNGQPRRRRFVHFVNAYHGDTLGVVSVGGIDLFHRVYGPLLFRGFKVPAPYSYRCPVKRAGCPPCRFSCLRPFEEVMRRRHREIAGVVVEPLVQGAAGMITQPAGWLQRVERACRRYGVFLIADEVAVGFGRTGRMFACEHENVRPDFLCLAKGLTGGYLPLAATLATEKIYRGFLGSYASQRTFFHGHSYTGNPLACAVALENLRLFRREKILQKLRPKIQLFEKELERFRELEHVGDIRQKGLMAGVELVRDKGTRQPYPWQERMGIHVCRALRRRGILLRPLGNVIVLMPPLAITEEEISFLCSEVRQAIETVTGRCYTARVAR